MTACNVKKVMSEIPKLVELAVRLVKFLKSFVIQIEEIQVTDRSTISNR